MAKLIILVGAPGVGKSTFAKELGGQIVSTDEIRKKLYGNENIKYSDEIAEYLIKEKKISLASLSQKQIALKKHEMCIEYIFELARKNANELLKNGEDVIFDSTNEKISHRLEILKCTKNAYSQLEAYFLDAPLNIILERNQTRSRKEANITIENIYNSIEAPTYSEGYDKIFIVNEYGNITLIKK